MEKHLQSMPGNESGSTLALITLCLLVALKVWQKLILLNRQYSLSLGSARARPPFMGNPARAMVCINWLPGSLDGDSQLTWSAGKIAKIAKCEISPFGVILIE